MPTTATRQILAEWRALEQVVDQVADQDDAAAIRDRIERLRRDYRQATGTYPSLEPMAPQQLSLPLRFAPYVVASTSSHRDEGDPST